MNFTEIFKSVIDQDKAHVVICDLNHTIIYMNPAAVKRYAKYGGAALVGKSLLNCHNTESRQMIQKVIDYFSSSNTHNIVHTYYNAKENRDVYMVALRNEKKELIGYYEKHEFRTKDETPLYDFSD